MMMSNCFLLPLASKSVSSPRSTLKMILRQCPTVIFVFACLVVKWIRLLQSGTCRSASKCQGPVALRSEEVASSTSAPASRAAMA